LKVALIFEGSYPYITGGVSSWAHQLIKALKDIDFVIISIMPSPKEKYTIKYELPKNVIRMETVYLEGFLELNPNQKPSEKISRKGLHEDVLKLLSFDKNVDWKNALEFLGNEKKAGNTVAFLKSMTFWKQLLVLYEEEFEHEDFNRFFWTQISIYLPFINLLQVKMPLADIYHSISTGYAGLLALACSSKYGTPLLLTEHGIYTREREEEIIKADWVNTEYKKTWIRYFHFIASGVYKNADKVISLFNKAREIQIALGSGAEKTIVIPNGVDLIRFKVCETEKSYLVVAAVLRIVPIKDVKTLLRAFKIVNNSMSETKLLLLGPCDEDEKYYEECKILTELLGIVDKVEFLGQRDIRLFFPDIDVLVLTSISEGQPLSILEGMASGIPCVATDVGSCRELIEGGPNDDLGPAGIITQPVSPQETAEAILEILNNRELRDRMKIAGRKRVELFYTVENVFDSYKKLYTETYYKSLSNKTRRTRKEVKFWQG